MTVAQKILRWYARHKHERALPWRDEKDPYKVWLSEIMLQQTTVATVKPYYARFLARWPDVEALAAASLDEVRAEWAGLGYYRRAAHLHAAAQMVAKTGGFPSDEAGLRQLPGVGPYTAAAIAAFAYGHKTNIIDGNIERIMARLHASNNDLAGKAGRLVPSQRAGDYAQGLMDLGALICTPRDPACEKCPLRTDCKGKKEAEKYPAKRRKIRILNYATAYVVLNQQGEIWLRQRAESGILAGLWEVPTTPFSPTPLADDAGLPKGLRLGRGPAITIRHSLTHRELIIKIQRVSGKPLGPGRWHAPSMLKGLPRLTQKIIEASLDGA